MKSVVLADSVKLLEALPIILRIRWPDLVLIHTAEGRRAIELIHKEQPDIVMLQLEVLSAESFDFISQIRSFSDVPLIVLSQSNDVMDKVRALEMGADDWITRSCPPMECIAKVNAILRRCPRRNCNSVASFADGKLGINFATREVFVKENPVRLTPIEYKIICELAKNEGSVVSHCRLLRTVWGPYYGDSPEFLKKYIYRLRSKIEEEPADPKMILNERGVGYILIPSTDSTVSRPFSTQMRPFVPN